MLQQVEYRPGPFYEWMQRSFQGDAALADVMQRQTLKMTKKAKLLLAFAYLIMAVWLAAIIVVVFTSTDKVLALLVCVMALLALPVVLGLSLVVVVTAGYVVIVKPHERKMIAETKMILQAHPGITIVVAGSYGKTTMKELLASVLGTKLRVAATAGNGNTPSAHAQFARSLKGDEDVVIFELGEGAPGDVKRFASTLHPNVAVITGLAPNHLDQYGTVEELARDFMTLREYVAVDKVYYAADSALLKKYINDQDQSYSVDGGKTWQITDVRTTADHTTFTLVYKGKTLHIESKLLGRHQVAPLALVAVLALDMGLTAEQVEHANRVVKPYEHRMSSYHLNGATIIDDTYNGNLEGIIAGLSFLATVEAKRKVYVTPGLVEQGEETEAVHRTIAAKIAEVTPDLLVLMRNSATDIIADELTKLHYTGEIQLQDDPLLFYQGLEHVVRGGDVVLMQNDWTDNYH